MTTKRTKRNTNTTEATTTEATTTQPTAATMADLAREATAAAAAVAADKVRAEARARFLAFAVEATANAYAAVDTAQRDAEAPSAQYLADATDAADATATIRKATNGLTYAAHVEQHLKDLNAAVIVKGTAWKSAAAVVAEALKAIGEDVCNDTARLKPSAVYPFSTHPAAKTTTYPRVAKALAILRAEIGTKTTPEAAAAAWKKIIDGGRIEERYSAMKTPSKSGRSTSRADLAADLKKAATLTAKQADTINKLNAQRAAAATTAADAAKMAKKAETAAAEAKTRADRLDAVAAAARGALAKIRANADAALAALAAAQADPNTNPADAMAAAAAALIEIIGVVEVTPAA